MTRRDRRALVIGGTVLVIAALGRGLPIALGALDRLQQEVADRSASVDRMQANVREVNALADSAADVRRRFVALAPSVLTGRTDAEAVADLTGRLNMFVAAHAASFDRADAIPDSARMGWLRRVTVRLTLESDLRGVMGALAAVERDPAVLVIRTIRLAAPDPASPETMPEIVKAEATISGWYLTRTPPQ